MPLNEVRIKTNRLVIYLIKSQYKELDDIVASEVQGDQIDGVGRFFYEESRATPAGWVRGFFGDALDDRLIFTASARGLLIVRIERADGPRHFAISFGFGRYMLKEGVVEEGFGLRVVLNSADAASFRSIDKTTLGAIPKHSREQMSRDVTPAEFGIDIEQDLVSLVTARSRDTRLGKIVTGKDALYLSAKIDATNIVEFLAHCIERYESEDYQASFDWIDQISEVRSQDVEVELNNLLVARINEPNLDKVWMAVPEVVTWSDLSGFRYQMAKRGDLVDDLDMAEFIDLFDVEPIEIEELKKTIVYAIAAENDGVVSKWPAFRCVYAELEVDGCIYVLNSGKWYEIAKTFAEEVQRDFASTPESTIALPAYTSGGEGDYNLAAAASLLNACCMDQKLIDHGGGHSKIEFCDVYTDDKKIVHVKKYAGSGTLSHLFSQGVVSGELFVGDQDFRRKLNTKLPKGYKLAKSRPRPNAAEYEIVFAVISKSAGDLDIPFFSKVSLRSARRRLASFGYAVTKKKIQKTA